MNLPILKSRIELPLSILFSVQIIDKYRLGKLPVRNIAKDIDYEVEVQKC